MMNESLSDNLIACHECDLIQTSAPLEPGQKTVCVRCNAALDKRPRTQISHTLAYTITAAICLCIANIYPVLSLEAEGLHSNTTLIHSARVMYHQGMTVVSILVLGTAVIAPALMLASILYLLLPLSMGKLPWGFPTLFRTLQWASPWAMIEVLMLGIIVSLVKLSAMATAHTGIGLWAFAATMVLIAMIAGGISENDLWVQYEKIVMQKASSSNEETPSSELNA